jgi:hypothetical protein
MTQLCELLHVEAQLAPFNVAMAPTNNEAARIYASGTGP